MYKNLPKKSAKLPYQGMPTPKIPAEPVKEEPITNHHKIAALYKSMAPDQRTQMLKVDLQHWPEEARKHFSMVAQDYLKHGLSAQDAVDIWKASMGRPQFQSRRDLQDYHRNIKMSKKLGFEPEGLKR